MSRALAEALSITEGTRREDYGSPLENHARTAALWSIYLDVRISPEQVCMLNILQKVSRSMHRLTWDSVVDICGYGANIEEIWREKGLPVVEYRVSGGTEAEGGET